MRQLSNKPGAKYKRKHDAGLKTLILNLQREFEDLRQEIRTSVLAARPSEPDQREQQQEQQQEKR
jgi:hypothetical protein